MATWWQQRNQREFASMTDDDGKHYPEHRICPGCGGTGFSGTSYGGYYDPPEPIECALCDCFGRVNQRDWYRGQILLVEENLAEEGMALSYIREQLYLHDHPELEYAILDLHLTREEAERDAARSEEAIRLYREQIAALICKAEAEGIDLD